MEQSQNWFDTREGLLEIDPWGAAEQPTHIRPEVYFLV